VSRVKRRIVFLFLPFCTVLCIILIYASV
jgi:hypothetical protein